MLVDGEDVLDLNRTLVDARTRNGTVCGRGVVR